MYESQYTIMGLSHNFLKRKIRGLGVAEIDQGYKCEVRAHENQVGFPLKFVDDCRGYHDDNKVLRSIISKSVHEMQACNDNHGSLTQSQLDEVAMAEPLARACSGRISGT